jgi:hypothetical protein
MSDRSAGLFVDERQDFGDAATDGLVGIDPEQACGSGIDEADHLHRVRGDHAVADARESGSMPRLTQLQTPLGAIAMHGQFDGDLELAVSDRLENVGERTGLLRTLEGRLIGVSREENDRSGHAIADTGSCLDAVHAAFESDVHQDQLRQGSLWRTRRLTRPCRRCRRPGLRADGGACVVLRR